MDERMKAALNEYGDTILAHGWKAGEALIAKYSEQYADFPKWAKAMAILLRVEEVLSE
jgi:hypothetical protein